MTAESLAPEGSRRPQRLVVAYDGSEPSVRAARFALRLITERPMDIWLVHAVSSPSSVAEPRPEEELVSETAGIEHGLRALQAGVDPAIHRVQVWIREGPAADVVLGACKEVNADLVVVGTRGLRGARRVFGSVSEAIVARSRWPVLVVP